MGKKINALKLTAGFAANMGAGMIVGAACATVLPVQGLRLIPKVLVMTGAWGIASGVGDFAENSVVKRIEQVEDAVTAIKTAVETGLEKGLEKGLKENQDYIDGIIAKADAEEAKKNNTNEGQ